VVSFTRVHSHRPCGARLAAATLLVVLGVPAMASTPITYVALGDSTAVGVGAATGGGYPQRLARKLETSGIAVKLVNLGVSGATVADVRRDQLPKAMSAGAQLVTIAIGINDLVAERSLRDFARDLEIVADLVRRTKATVVISNIPDLTLSPSAKGSPAGFRRRLEGYNAAIATVAERHGFLLADAYAASRAAIRASGAEAVFAADGFHPSALGYDRWTDALWPPVEQGLRPRVQARHGGDH
jgi:acyl-CoA thioesterase I